MEKVKTVIGIDPGSTTGFVEWDTSVGNVILKRTGTFWEAYEWVKGWSIRDTVVVVETPVKTAMYAKQEGAAAKGGHRYGMRMMSNAAANAREAELLADGIEELGYRVERLRPARHKWSASELEEYLNYTEKTNQHVRDAIQLCCRFLGLA